MFFTRRKDGIGNQFNCKVMLIFRYSALRGKASTFGDENVIFPAELWQLHHTEYQS